MNESLGSGQYGHITAVGGRESAFGFEYRHGEYEQQQQQREIGARLHSRSLFGSRHRGCSLQPDQRCSPFIPESESEKANTMLLETSQHSTKLRINE